VARSLLGMANTKFGYVRGFEADTVCLPNTFIVVRIDGRGFTKFTKAHDMEKPNDPRGLDVMNKAALQVVRAFPDIFLAYGQSDEYSFIFQKSASLFQRRHSKILTTIVSLFSSAYVYHWPECMGQDNKLKSIPQFDGRIVLYPTTENLKDYLRWRQADCHINNLFNTTFWALVQKGGRTPREAEADLSGTVSKDKHEIMFTRFSINYNEEPAQYRKGTVISRTGEPQKDSEAGDVQVQPARVKGGKRKPVPIAAEPVASHVDMGPKFWETVGL